MATFQPVPTYADPVIVDEKSGKGRFNPVWLQWFLSLTDGGLSGTIAHDSLQGLQGGGSGGYFHLTADQYDNVYVRDLTPPVTLTADPSPWTYQNGSPGDVDEFISGAGVTKVEFSRDNITWYDTFLKVLILRLSPGDYMKITYAGAVAVVEVPR